tara:strand:- start:2841 stop:3971 length:1131 start_codon:yes stop_codon:yes gene_type:complete
MEKGIKMKKDSKKEITTPDIVCHAELKTIKSDSDDLFIEGFASTKDIDRVDDIVEPTAFKKTLKAFMENPVLMFNHGMGIKGRDVVGKIVESEIREKGLWVKAFISETEQELRTKIKEGLFKAFSFGFKILKSDMIKQAGKDIRKIAEVELLEVSVVSIPANRRALFSVSKAFECGTDLIYENDFVEGLKDNFDVLRKDVKDIKIALSMKDLKEDIEKDGCSCGKPDCEMEGLSKEEEKKLEKLFTKDSNEEDKKETVEERDASVFYELLKSAEKEIDELKAGRVISGKNRKALSTAVEAMEGAIGAVKAVLDIQSPKPAEDEESDTDIDELKPHLDKPRKRKKESDICEDDELIDDELIAKVAEAANDIMSIANN